MARRTVKKPTKVYLQPQEAADLARLARLEEKARGEPVDVSPLARELLVPAIRAKLAEHEPVAA